MAEGSEEQSGIFERRVFRPQIDGRFDPEGIDPEGERRFRRGRKRLVQVSNGLLAMILTSAVSEPLEVEEPTTHRASKESGVAKKRQVGSFDLCAVVRKADSRT